MLFIKRIIFIIFILLGPLTLYTFAALLLDVNHYNARLYGSGEGLLVEDNDLNNLEIFPSSLATIKGNAISVGYINWAQMVNIYRVAYGYNLGASDVLAFSANYAGNSGMNNYDASGNLMGQLSSSDFALNTAYAFSITPHVHVGMDLKYLNMAIESYRASWLGLTLSAMMGIKIFGFDTLNKDNFFFGASVQNFGILSAKFDQNTSDYPLHIRPGFTWNLVQNDAVKVEFGSAFDYATIYDQSYVNTGVEVGIYNLLFLRTGYSVMPREFSKYCFGIGINRQITDIGITLKVDYAINLGDNVQNQFIQLGIGF